MRYIKWKGFFKTGWIKGKKADSERTEQLQSAIVRIKAERDENRRKTKFGKAKRTQKSRKKVKKGVDISADS